MKFISYSLLVVSIIVLSACNDKPTNSSVTLGDFTGDVHGILEIDSDELINKYTVFNVSFLLEGFDEDLFTRKVAMMSGLSNIQDESKYNYVGKSESESIAAGRKAFKDFSKLHGEVVDEEVENLRAPDSYSSQIQQTTFTFKAEKGYTPLLMLSWSQSTIRNEVIYRMEVVEIHRK